MLTSGYVVEMDARHTNSIYAMPPTQNQILLRAILGAPIPQPRTAFSAVAVGALVRACRLDHVVSIRIIAASGPGLNSLGRFTGIQRKI